MSGRGQSGGRGSRGGGARGAPRGGPQGGGQRGSSPSGGAPRGGGPSGPRGGGGQAGYQGAPRGGFPPRGSGGPGGNQPPPQAPLSLGPAVVDSRLDKANLDQLVKDLGALRLEVGGFDLPLKPGFGTVGTPVTLRANYFAVTKMPDVLYEYEVKISPAIENRRMKRRLFDLLEKVPAFSQYAAYTANDGSSKLIAAKKIPLGTTGVLDVPVKLYDEDEREDQSTKTFVLSLSFVHDLETGPIKKYVNGSPEHHTYQTGPVVSALNIILCKFAAQSGGIRMGINKKKDDGNKFFFKMNPTPLDGLLEAWRGFYSSVRPTMGQLSVNLNVATAAFYKEQNLADALMLFERGSYGGNPSSFVEGLRVKTHIGHKKTIYRVGRSTPRTEKFFTEQWGEVTVEQYFQKQYNKRLRYPTLRLVDVGNRTKHTYLPPEMCDILPNQPFRGRLTGQQTRVMIDVALRSPADNQADIYRNGLPRMGFSPPSSTLDAFGIKIHAEMAVVRGRILPPPSISFGGNKSAEIRNSAWNMNKDKFHAGAPLRFCAAVVVSEGNRDDFVSADDPALRQIVKDFTDKCAKLGMGTKNATWLYEYTRIPPGQEDPTRTRALQSISEAVRRLKKPNGPKPDLIMFFLSSDDKFIYPNLKRFCDVQLDVLNVCVMNPKIRKERGQDQYFTNVALKLNMKLGGINHVIKTGSTASTWLKAKRTMLVGCDVTHPSPGSQRGTPSIAAVVASTDDNFAQYPASLRLQESRKEMITELDEMMVERLKRYEKTAGPGKFPERIIMYRDGVSEGQFLTVLREELPLIRKACRNVQNGYNPKLTIAIAGKRHHTRFYPTDAQQADQRNNGNTMPGTVVDQGVTAVFDFDFYLQSHAGLKGTVRPTHYTVILDECGFTADSLQNVTHALSHTYQRATRGVSLAPPAYYADLACERGRCYIFGLLNAADAASTAPSTSSEAEAAATFAKARTMWGQGPGPLVRERMFYL